MQLINLCGLHRHDTQRDLFADKLLAGFANFRAFKREGDGHRAETADLDDPIRRRVLKVPAGREGAGALYILTRISAWPLLPERKALLPPSTQTAYLSR